MTDAEEYQQKRALAVKANGKPRVRFCWSCGNELWGNHFDEVLTEGHVRIFHKACAEEIKEGQK